MKKILFFYGSYGGGHLSAAKSLKEYIDKNYPDCETKLVDFMEYVNKTVKEILYESLKEILELEKNSLKKSIVLRIFIISPN